MGISPVAGEVAEHRKTKIIAQLRNSGEGGERIPFGRHAVALRRARQCGI